MDDKLSPTKPGAPKVVAIHQPNFFPWLGYFDKLIRADVFVLLDHVLIQKTGGSWSNRVKLKIGGEARWVTAPIVRGHGEQAICDVTFDETRLWREKTLQTLRLNYGRAPYFSEAMDLVEPLIMNPERFLARYNRQAVEAIATALCIPTAKIVSSSSLDVVACGTDALVAITQAVGGTAYMCGGGAAGYQEDHQFEAHGLSLIYQSFNVPHYEQFDRKPFVGGLSVLDALFSLGIDGSRNLLACR